MSPATVSTERSAVQRGDVWVVALEPVVGSEQAKTRPCIVVQRDAANRAGRTTRPFGRCSRAGDSGIAKDSVALCRQVRVVDFMRLRKKLGSLGSVAIDAVSRGLVEILDLESACQIGHGTKSDLLLRTELKTPGFLRGTNTGAKRLRSPRRRP